MPIIFICLSETFTEKIKKHGYEAHTMRIEEYKPIRKTFYVSPANSLCFMDGGIDYALSRIVFPEIEPIVKQSVKLYGKTSLVGKPYLPIGSSIIVNKKDSFISLVVAPTMLLPQNVQGTQNAYYATMAILYNVLINNKNKMEDIDILFTSFCCGYGKMGEDESIKQILRGIQDYTSYEPSHIPRSTVVIHEPNLQDQPKFYQNTEFFNIYPKDIINV
jgi:O-acetyl-ADP-ribose deacetylase (regulator of RNase III)